MSEWLTEWVSEWLDVVVVVLVVGAQGVGEEKRGERQQADTFPVEHIRHISHCDVVAADEFAPIWGS